MVSFMHWLIKLIKIFKLKYLQLHLNFQHSSSTSQCHFGDSKATLRRVELQTGACELCYNIRVAVQEEAETW